ncbi:monovalent cation/H+ antiporter subunit D [Reinekea blandensis]|uniref:Formate hydrogenlyase subunit 3/Multisubunit Na+/H+ antiporter, MnhD subunit n=1 Tax=Reinekea blandensis MED297 TaxID=314283 RepID=A4B983_9GAMM|nr:monovalent cation/H+ antiporter subunit D [Reinekea blandensis]EAR11184.1 Formate hydrogenlyase subunit 3/Multisubunit Na+/H+ antiporter, MnhD subunit [Reinekea sp. MED297] [Reinekea blandensis MED297]
MTHLPILPILLPSLVGILLILPPFANHLRMQRWFTLGALGVLVIIAIELLMTTDQSPLIYILGGWHPPFGIMLLADRLSALLVLLTAVLAFCAALYGAAYEETTGRFFYPLFLFQIMGINGAFLTGDAFNLFVFFEILLIASYALLIHGGGKEKTKASFHYITLNLIGSAFFLIALGTLYGTLGTLNMADMSNRVTTLMPSGQIIAKAGGMLLLVVFGLKSAMLPLQFWLPKTYAAASAPVAALFAIMTKVGLYSIYRVFGGIFGETAGSLAFMAHGWIWPLAIATLVFGMLGALAAPSLRLLTSNMVIISVGTLLLTFVVNQGNALGAGLYYLIHSTLVTGALFLLADQIRVQRGNAQDRFVVSRPMAQGKPLGILYMIAAIAVVGLPPLSGFIGKLLVLQGAVEPQEQTWLWGTVLVSSLLALIAFSRAGTALFWHLSGSKPGSETAHPLQWTAIVLLLSASPLLTIFAGPVTEFTDRAADDVVNSHEFVLQIIDQQEALHSDGH